MKKFFAWLLSLFGKKAEDTKPSVVVVQPPVVVDVPGPVVPKPPVEDENPIDPNSISSQAEWDKYRATFPPSTQSLMSVKWTPKAVGTGVGVNTQELLTKTTLDWDKSGRWLKFDGAPGSSRVYTAEVPTGYRGRYEMSIAGSQGTVGYCSSVDMKITDVDGVVLYERKDIPNGMNQTTVQVTKDGPLFLTVTLNTGGAVTVNYWHG